LLSRIACLFLFVFLIVSLQLENYLLVALWAVGSLVLFGKSAKTIRSVIVLQLLFGIGFFLYLYVNSNWNFQADPREWQVFWRSVSLAFILLPLFGLAFISDRLFISYLQKPNWDEPLYFPFIWNGFHRTPVKTFLMIALSVNVAIFVPILIVNGVPLTREIWLLAICFAVSNALLEELVWRGALLSLFSELLGDKWAVALTSIGFGLQHYSLGFPWLVCLAMSIGGLFFGGITIKSNSIFPAIIWHFVLNILMVLSGVILR